MSPQQIPKCRENGRIAYGKVMAPPISNRDNTDGGEPGSWAVRSLFDLAMDQPADVRESFVVERVGRDSDVARRTLVLLRSVTESAGPGPIVQFDTAVYSENETTWTPMLAAGDTIELQRGNGSRLTIVKHIATGSAGEIYEAVRERPSGSVAVKVLRSRPQDQDAARRLTIEAEMLALLDHPGIVPVLGAGVIKGGPAHGHPCVVMGLIEGERLDHWCDRTSPSARQSAAIIAQVARAVHHANLRGVVHRDLKPSNVLIDDGGRVRVIDFGVARMVSMDGRGVRNTLASMGNTVVGTLEYMAPEQFSPSARGIDLRADVYALGAMLYEMIAGRVPVDTSGWSIGQIATKKETSRPIPLLRVGRNEGHKRERSGARGISRELSDAVSIAIDRDRSRPRVAVRVVRSVQQ